MLRQALFSLRFEFEPMSSASPLPVDRVIAALDRGLRALFVTPAPSRPTPQPLPGAGADDALDDRQRRHAAGLMRVNHVGEVCAQALYAAQAASTRNEALRTTFIDAAREEADHLAWTAERLRELRSRPSLLNPLWYAGSFALGWIAGRSGDANSLGFVVETERQVEEHLAGHLTTLPAEDARSRVIVEAMQADEREHADRALRDGATPLPPVVAHAMRGVAKVMTTTAYWI
jgi:3-demethoxyubiquinol 3-hydroxylase